MIEMIVLPYAFTDLEPYMSAQTFEYHYGKHYKNYVDTLNKLIAGTKYENMSLEDIIQATYGKTEEQAIFNNAGQVWNHQFFWKSMTPRDGGKPKGKLLELIEKEFGSYENFRQEFKKAALGRFGSGWAWLVPDNEGLKIITTANGDTPIAWGVTPIIGLDVWEHAYYLDYRNNRGEFIDVFMDRLANWQ